MVAKAKPAKVSKPAPKSAGSAAGAGKKVVVTKLSKPTKAAPKPVAKAVKTPPKAAKPASKPVAKQPVKAPAKPAPKPAVAPKVVAKQAKVAPTVAKSAKIVKKPVAKKPLAKPVSKTKAPVVVAKSVKPSSKPAKVLVSAKAPAKPAPKAPAPVKIPVKGKSPVVVSPKATTPLPKNAKVSAPEPKLPAVKATKTVAKPVEVVVAKPEVVKPAKSGKLELYVGTFFQEVVPGSPAVRKTKTPHAPVPSLKKPKGEESHDELIARIERELLTVRMVTRKVQRTQVCTKCCINPVEPGYMVDRDTGYCAECAVVLGLGHTREARQQNFHPSLMKSEEEEVVIE